MLYTLMLNDRYRRPIDYGLLFYISTGDLIKISAYRRDIQSILIKRNIFAQHLKRDMSKESTNLAMFWIWYAHPRYHLISCHLKY